MVQLEDADFAMLGDSVDLSQVPALSLAHVVGHVNQATALLVQHLNRFGRAADEKLRSMAATISRLETELIILETKLASIPGLESVTASSASPQPIAAQPEKPPVQPQPTVSEAMVSAPAEKNLAWIDALIVSKAPATPTPAASASPLPPAERSVGAEPTPTPEQPSTPVLTVQKDPVYAKYFRMVQLGVPAAAVRIKMSSEGLNPALLDTPNAPSPNPPAAADEDENNYATSSDED